jgi:hypothetical protein
MHMHICSRDYLSLVCYTLSGFIGMEIEKGWDMTHEHKSITCIVVHAQPADNVGLFSYDGRYSAIISNHPKSILKTIYMVRYSFNIVWDFDYFLYQSLNRRIDKKSRKAQSGARGTTVQTSTSVDGDMLLEATRYKCWLATNALVTSGGYGSMC